MGQQSSNNANIFLALQKDIDSGKTKQYEKHAEQVFKRFDTDKSGT